MATMTDSARQQQGTELQKKLYDLQQRFEKGARGAGADRAADPQRRILGQMQPIIQTIAQRDGFTMVFERPTPVYVRPAWTSPMN